MTREWSAKGNNFRTPTEALGIKYAAVLTCISKNCGFEHTEVYDKAVDVEMFKSYLKVLAAKNKRKRLVIFMDNLAVHKNKEVQNLMLELKFEWIWNVPYSPEF